MYNICMLIKNHIIYVAMLWYNTNDNYKVNSIIFSESVPFKCGLNEVSANDSKECNIRNRKIYNIFLVLYPAPTLPLSFDVGWVEREQNPPYIFVLIMKTSV